MGSSSLSRLELGSSISSWFLAVAEPSRIGGRVSGDETCVPKESCRSGAKCAGLALNLGVGAN